MLVLKFATNESHTARGPGRTYSGFQPLHTTSCQTIRHDGDRQQLRPRRRPDARRPGCGAAGARSRDASRPDSSRSSKSVRVASPFSVVAMPAHLLPQLVRDVAARSATGCDSMRRGRGITTGNSATTRPGRLESSTTRSPRRTASRTLWVTNRIVSPCSLPQPLELVVQEVARHRVEGAERLVHQQDVGVLRQRARQLHPLAHPARELVRELALEPLEVDDLQQLAHPRLRRCAFGTRWSLSASSTLPCTVSHGNSAASWNMSVVRAVRPRPCPRWGGRGRRRGSAACSCRSRTRRAGRRTRRARTSSETRSSAGTASPAWP